MTIKNFSKLVLGVLFFSLFIGMAQPAEALPPLCSLTYTAGEGGTVDGSDSVLVRVFVGATGRVVEAVPNSGYRFVDWDDSLATASRSDLCPGGAGLNFVANFTRVGTPTFFMPVGLGIGANNRIVTMNDRGFVGVVDNSGINLFVYPGATAEFELSVGGDDERHELKPLSLDMNTRVLTVQFASDPQVLEMSLGETVQVDLNADKVADLSVKYQNLLINRAELTLLPADSEAVLSQTEETGTTTGTVAKYIFTRDLTLSDMGVDVKELQKYLNVNGFSVAQVGVGSLGNESNYFGTLTQKALIRYQLAKGISPAIGYFGPITRAFMNK